MRAAPKYDGTGEVAVAESTPPRARALQGVGAAILAPSALSLLARSFAEGRARNRAMAAYSAVAGLGAALGLVVGGLVADLISWRAGFFLNVPVGIAMVALTVRFLPATERHGGRFDVAGALLATAGSTALVFGIVVATDIGWTAPATAGPVRPGGAAGRASPHATAAVRQP
ncbi:MFS transporter [Streptomyces sp. NBC_00887]|uniref:MFS transporter n=1 Tax=Streptomyces sp. NBC_00887 TaxID=2975859 RepID=UPI0038690198|nr:MFS transporter [Streptomyces sp. NBC_00887]